MRTALSNVIWTANEVLLQDSLLSLLPPCLPQQTCSVMSGDGWPILEPLDLLRFQENLYDVLITWKVIHTFLVKQVWEVLSASAWTHILPCRALWAELIKLDFPAPTGPWRRILSCFPLFWGLKFFMYWRSACLPLRRVTLEDVMLCCVLNNIIDTHLQFIVLHGLLRTVNESHV